MFSWGRSTWGPGWLYFLKYTSSSILQMRHAAHLYKKNAEYRPYYASCILTKRLRGWPVCTSVLKFHLHCIKNGKKILMCFRNNVVIIWKTSTFYKIRICGRLHVEWSIRTNNAASILIFFLSLFFPFTSHLFSQQWNRMQ